MDEDVTLIITIAIIIVFSPFFAKLLKLPTTPVEIILGSVLAYLGFIHDGHLFEIAAEIGFLYLMFIAGTEINLKNILKTPKTIMQRVMLYLALLYGFSITFSLYFELDNIFILLLPLISVGLIATLIKEYGKTPWLNIAMTAGAIGEVASIAILTITSAGLKSGIGLELFKILFALILFLIIMYFIFRAIQLLFWWYPEFSKILMPQEDNQEQDIRLSLAIFLLLVASMLYLNLELAFGAFLAGIFVPTFFEHKHNLPEKLASFGFGFLIPIFFIHIGTTFDLNALSLDGLISKAFLIMLVMVSMRVLASLVFVQKLGFVGSILMGLSHSMPLTLLIAMATLAFNANSIDQLHYYAFILAALFQVLGVTITIKLINNTKKRKEKKLAIIS